MSRASIKMKIIQKILFMNVFLFVVFYVFVVGFLHWVKEIDILDVGE